MNGRPATGYAAASSALALVAVAPHPALPALPALLAATAGTLFEAAPFALLAEFLPRRVRPLARGAGCGCAGRGGLPGALAPLALAFCWSSFGPAVALGRAAVAALLALAWQHRESRRRGHDAAPCDPAPHDAFADLTRLAACAAATAAFTSAAAAAMPNDTLRFVAGLVLGVVAPCATAGVAMAAGTAPHAPLLAAGILVTAGILPLPALPFPLLARPPGRETVVDARFPLLLLALALGVLCLRGASGLVNPRLVPVAGAGALAAIGLALAKRRPVTWRGASLAPAIMLAALVTGSPTPAYSAAETTAALGFAGEPIAFTGVANGGSNSRLVRFAIACCRLDARAQTLELDRRIGVPDGSWVALRGRFIERAGRLVVRPDSWRRVAAPADPFVYF